MSPEMTQYLIYAGLAVGGWLFRHWFPQLAPGTSPATIPASSAIPALPVLPVLSATPAGGIMIGHGELLALITSALKAQPPVLVPTATPPPTATLPTR